MKYTARTGIVYRMIADEHFLISLGEAAGICPAIKQINESAAYYWELLKEGNDVEQMLDAAQAESGMEREILRPGLEEFLNRLEKEKYIIREENPKK